LGLFKSDFYSLFIHFHLLIQDKEEIERESRGSLFLNKMAMMRNKRREERVGKEEREEALITHLQVTNVFAQKRSEPECNTQHLGMQGHCRGGIERKLESLLVRFLTTKGNTCTVEVEERGRGRVRGEGR
jgi:hypothetical protein